MTGAAPIIYLLHGEDEFAIAQFVSELEAKLGDPATAMMNFNRLDGRTSSLEELISIASTMPFLARRRLVILIHPLARLANPSARQSFIAQLESIPPTTALVLIEYRLLTDERGKKKGQLHWLEEWAQAAGERVYLRAFPLPKGGAMGRWVQDHARQLGGQFTPQAADLLGSLVGGDTRLADQEIQKLLAYVDFRRPVEFDDVETLTADAGQEDIFAMVDALGGMDGRRAMRMLHRLLEQQEPGYIFGMIVRQFRLLILVSEVLNKGGKKDQVLRELNLNPFVADKLLFQVRRFSLPDLEQIYHRLLDLDEAIKTGQISGELALETFIAAFTVAGVHSHSSR